MVRSLCLRRLFAFSIITGSLLILYKSWRYKSSFLCYKDPYNHRYMSATAFVLCLQRLSSDMPLQLASETLLRMLRARLHHHRQGQVISLSNGVFLISAIFGHLSAFDFCKSFFGIELLLNRTWFHAIVWSIFLQNWIACWSLFQIVHNLSRALDTDARLARLEERSRHVQINDESLCDSCHARLGTKLFAMYPDDSIVCYKVGNTENYIFRFSGFRYAAKLLALIISSVP